MVVVKALAVENMVTYLRVKLVPNDKEVGGEGQNMSMKLEYYFDPLLSE